MLPKKHWSPLIRKNIQLSLSCIHWLHQNYIRFCWHRLGMEQECVPVEGMFSCQIHMLSFFNSDIWRVDRSLSFNADLHYRFAEQHIYVVLAVLLRNFQLKYPVGESMSQVYHTLLFPDRPVRVIFENRTL